MIKPKLSFNGTHSEWEKKRIIDICQILDSKRKPISEKNRVSGPYPYYGANNIQDYVNDFIFDGSYILIAEDGGNFEDFQTRPIAQYVNGKFWVNNHAHILQGIDVEDTKLIFYLCEHKDIRSFINGSTRGKLTQEDLRRIEIALPVEKSERQRIATFFTTLDEKIQNTCKKLALTLKIKGALVRDILNREVGFSSSSDWQDVTLGDVSSIIKTRKSSEFLLYVGTEDLIKDFGGLNKVKKEDISGIYFEKDDILISNIRPYLKKLWMSDEEGIASTDVIVYRPKNIEPSLLKHILSTNVFFKHVAQGYKGSKMPRGDKSQMATFAFQIPSNEKEQKQIANFLNLIDKKITCLREQERALKKQKQAFMQQMFV